MERRNLTYRAVACLLALLLAAPMELMAATPTPELPDPGKPGMSKEQQEQVGLQAMAQVYQQMPVLPDSSPMTQYVQHLGKKLEAVIPPDHNWPFQFHVIPASDINAFALPGGPMFVNAGAIQAADNEAELVGVMAHEMSHVYMQHSAKQAPKAGVAQVIAGLAGAVLGGSAIGRLAAMGIQFGAGTMLMKYSRHDESQADAVGSIIMYKAGYNPKAMADFFTKLEQKYGSGGPQFLSDHPNPGNRQAAIEKEIAEWPAKNYTTSSSAFDQAKHQASSTKTYSAKEIDAGAKNGTWAQQNKKNGAIPANLPAASGGAADNGTMANVSLKQVKPSGRFTQLQQNGFSISYPDNWQAANGQNSLMIGPQQGMSQSGIAYGVLISAAQSNGGSLDQNTQQLIQGIVQGNPGMQANGNPSNINVAGTQGRSVYLSGTSPVQQNGQPVPERDWLVTVPDSQGGLMYLVFVAPQKDFNQLKSTYQKMLKSLQLR
ncbi:MAG TPA: M48 family metallopeptidase [Terriglobales bacterium]|nr:M48 family metallopeptidase [Terriglobales bacterium]